MLVCLLERGRGEGFFSIVGEGAGTTIWSCVPRSRPAIVDAHIKVTSHFGLRGDKLMGQVVDEKQYVEGKQPWRYLGTRKKQYRIQWCVYIKERSSPVFGNQALDETFLQRHVFWYSGGWVGAIYIYRRTHGGIYYYTNTTVSHNKHTTPSISYTKYIFIFFMVPKQTTIFPFLFFIFYL